MTERWQRALRPLRSLEPSPGLWERVGELADDHSRGGRERSSGHHPRRTAAVVGIAVVALGAFALWRLLPLAGRPGGFGEGRHPEAVMFAEADGWFTDSSGTEADGHPFAWATNDPGMAEELGYTTEGQGGILAYPPVHATETMDAGDVVLVAVTPFRDVVPGEVNSVQYPIRQAPLQLADARRTARLEMSVDEAWVEYRLQGLVDGQYASLLIYFSSTDPTPAARELAQAQLSRLLLPDSPPGGPDLSGVEGTWFDARGLPLPDGRNAGNGFEEVMQVRPGLDHCDWESATFMTLTWPLGSSGGAWTGWPPGEWRQYIRDPDGILTGLLEGPFEPAATMPPDAEGTGFHRGSWALWMALSDHAEAVYVVNGSLVERWPLARRTIACD